MSRFLWSSVPITPAQSRTSLLKKNWKPPSTPPMMKKYCLRHHKFQMRFRKASRNSRCRLRSCPWSKSRSWLTTRRRRVVEYLLSSRKNLTGPNRMNLRLLSRLKNSNQSPQFQLTSHLTKNKMNLCLISLQERQCNSLLLCPYTQMK